MKVNRNTKSREAELAENARIPWWCFPRLLGGSPLSECRNASQTTPAPPNGLDRHAILRGKRPGFDGQLRLAPPGKTRGKWSESTGKMMKKQNRQKE